MTVDKTSADGRIGLWHTSGRSDHADIDPDMSYHRLEPSSSGQSLADSLTTIGRGHDDTGDIIEICGEVDNPGVGLLVAVQDVYSR